jgi:5-methylcytosine-specific restriction endonuclease McrA
MRDHRAANPDHIRAREAARYERHRDKRIELAVEASHRRRARMQDAPTEPGITVTYLRRRDGDACCYCGVVLVFGRYPKGQRPDNLATLEHRIPISRGGGHTDANCALACWRCNIGKGGMTEDEWNAKRTGRRLPIRFTSHPGLIG